MACAVSLDPPPVMILARPLATDFPTSTSLIFSGSVRVLVSPVVPVTTIPSAPALMTSSMCFSTPAQSTSPSAVNGVTRATSTWPKGFDVVDTSYRVSRRVRPLPRLGVFLGANDGNRIANRESTAGLAAGRMAMPTLATRSQRRRQMLPSIHNGENRRFHGGPIPDHLVVVKSKADEGKPGENRVTPEVSSALVRFAVMLVAIDLDDQPVADDEVDATDTGDLHLRSHLDAQAQHSVTKEGFRSRVGVAVRSLEEPPPLPAQFLRDGASLLVGQHSAP